MKIQLRTFLILILGLFIFSACAGTPVKLESSKPEIDLTKIDFSKGRDITASASGFQLLLLIPIQINSRHERAYQILKGKAAGDYITDINIQESWGYGFVGTVYTTTIKAKAYPYKEHI
jgi:hypothetical protein